MILFIFTIFPKILFLNYSLVGGNPAKLIKYRFTPEQIDKMLEIKWWFWDDNKINKFIPLLCNNDIDTFINSSFKYSN